MEPSEKDALRKRIWDLLEKENVARFPLPPHGRIPNFNGAENAARILRDSKIWREAEVLKCNPDSPQKPVREFALAQGKTVYMAVPRLRDERCFIELHKSRIYGSPAKGATIKGAFKFGKKVGPKHMKKVDIIVAGSVAVDSKGARLGKGGGFSDLEFALALEFGVVSSDTPVVSTVHSLQVVDSEIPMTSHDVPLDLVVTPKDSIRIPKREKPKGILWDELKEEKIAEIPILMKLRKKRQ
ncbi:MAG: 5-formyltetrahydrofolate cyclo-ligase [Methanomassiliicoccales archaeon]|nr:MAG: 5-formyltetrahydrofolate cyclo-ligase [Methanomassiliicoccales archaeon]